MLWHAAVVICAFGNCTVAVGSTSYQTHATCEQNLEKFASPVAQIYKNRLHSASFVNVRCLVNREGTARPSAKYVLRLIGPNPSRTEL